MRLIDAEKLCLHLADIQLANRGWKDDYCEVLDDIILIIDEQTTIEAEPVRHGEWIEPEEYTGHTEWHCSYCGDVVCTICGYPSADYCPNCGAKMEGKNEDGVD